MVAYMFKTVNFADNQGGRFAENVTSTIINRYQTIPLQELVPNAPLNSQVNNKAYLELNFGVGEYIIDHSIIIRTNVIIKGEGVNKTKIRFSREFNEIYQSAGVGHAHCLEWDDAFISVQGQKDREVSLEITNLTMEMDRNSDDNIPELILVKVGHANKLIFRDVNSRYDNCIGHNLDMRVCSNITVENCRFTAYNNLIHGAILAVRGNTENVIIRENEFHKHGNDEMVTFFGYADDLNNRVNVDHEWMTVIPHNNYKRNILIEGNSFNYDSAEHTALGEFPIDNPVHTIDVVLSIYDFDANAYPSSNIVEDHNFHKIKSEIKDITIRNNHFVANDAPVGTWVSFTFSGFVEQSGISVEGNLFSQGLWTRPAGVEPLGYRKNITINDNSFKPAPIVIRNNELINKDVSWVTYDSGVSYETRHSFICTHGGNLLVEGNRVFDMASGGNYKRMTFIEMEELEEKYSQRNFEEKNQGVGLMAIIKDNHIEGMQQFAFFVRNFHSLICMKVLNNYIKGGTYINVRDVERIDLTMENNELHSTAAQLLYKRSPKDGNLVLNRNTVYNEYYPSGGNTPSEQPFFINYDWNNNEYLTMNLRYFQMLDNNFVNFGQTVFNYAINHMMPNGCLLVTSNNTY